MTLKTASDKVYYSDAGLTTVYTKADAAIPNPVYVDWTKTGYRLPTEAEWEYAARFTDGTAIWNRGDHVSGDTDGLYKTEYAWCEENNGNAGDSDYGSKQVTQKTANALGIYDMSGNVWEWCYDWHGDYGSGQQKRIPPARQTVRPVPFVAVPGASIWIRPAGETAIRLSVIRITGSVSAIQYSRHNT